MQKCIDYCYEDIGLLPELQIQYKEEQIKKNKTIFNFYSKNETEKELSKVEKFKGDIPVFKRLSIIYEKSKDYENA